MSCHLVRRERARGEKRGIALQLRMRAGRQKDVAKQMHMQHFTRKKKISRKFTRSVGGDPQDGNQVVRQWESWRSM